MMPDHTTGRTRLREELIAAARVAAPGAEPVVAHDPGARELETDGGSGEQRLAVVLVVTGAADIDVGSAVSRAARELRHHGWQIEAEYDESAGLHRAAGVRGGAGAAVHGWVGQWRIVLMGQTPVT